MSPLLDDLSPNYLVSLSHRGTTAVAISRLTSQSRSRARLLVPLRSANKRGQFRSHPFPIPIGRRVFRPCMRTGSFIHRAAESYRCTICLRVVEYYCSTFNTSTTYHQLEGALIDSVFGMVSLTGLLFVM